MSIYQGYLMRTIAFSVFTVLLVLLGFFSFFSFVDQLGATGRGNYGVDDAIKYTLLMMPSMAYQLFAPAALIGALMGLGGLASNSEITAMRASGMTLSRLVSQVVMASLFLVVVSLLIGEWLAPEAQRRAEMLRSIEIYNKANVKQLSGVWVKQGNQIMNIKNVGANGVLSNIKVIQFDGDRAIKNYSQIDKAQFLQNKQWQLKGIQTRWFNESNVDLIAEEKKSQSFFLSPDVVEVVVAKPEAMSVFGLYQYIAHLRQNDIETDKYEQSLWNKIIAPVTTIAMVLLALPFVMGSTRQFSAGHRVLIGVLVGLGFHIVNQMSSYGGIVYGVNPLVAAATPTAVCLLAAIWLLRRVR